MPLTQGAALGWLLLPRWGVWVNYNIIAKKIAFSLDFFDCAKAM